MTTGKVVPGDEPGILSAWGPLTRARLRCRVVTRVVGRPRQFYTKLNGPRDEARATEYPANGSFDRFTSRSGFVACI